MAISIRIATSRALHKQNETEILPVIFFNKENSRSDNINLQFDFCPVSLLFYYRKEDYLERFGGSNLLVRRKIDSRNESKSD